MIDKALEFITHISPTNIYSMGVYMSIIFGIVWLFKIVVSGEHTRKLIELFNDYLRDKKEEREERKRDYQTLFDSLVDMKQEIDRLEEENKELKNKLIESEKDREDLHLQLNQLQSKFKEYAEGFKKGKEAEAQR